MPLHKHVIYDSLLSSSTMYCQNFYSTLDSESLLKELAGDELGWVYHWFSWRV